MTDEDARRILMRRGKDRTIPEQRPALSPDEMRGYAIGTAVAAQHDSERHYESARRWFEARSRELARLQKAEAERVLRLLGDE